MNMMKAQNLSRNSLLVRAPAKINLHLEVLGLRSDGFHELAMVMQSIDLFDQIEITSTNDGSITLSCNDPSLKTDEENLIIRAATLLRNRFGSEDLGASIHLEKSIPIGAGLAGGSSDGAATLVGLNALWGLNLSSQELHSLAAKLGSDVPFCLTGGTQLCFGRGEILEMLPSSCNSMAILLLKDPFVSVSTPLAYGRSKELYGSKYLLKESDFEIRRESLRKQNWLNLLDAANPPPLRNDLQKVVSPITPAVQKALNLLEELPGALSVAMSGSGPSCFALFAGLEEAKSALNQNIAEFKSAGFDCWCCSLISQGILLEKND
ncbi:4-(cytidine 5'-diphospho)-2-C-methyl-D-erythritol kinase [Prochlorococcus sp. MIT 1300]|uniref:4-(cytidine 5'-diphospho)-2-C-methyl-D-erythritol kinase n=1 Tax=Prochlorococcus sp. MIT 1300 TaxID=3096218 RepID=UPI002A76081A|nr:4-(cytidine 5'-diphospho)-2-C-methyl-D-erythritol kinase [Prochlorococcus sp. MIT 1300]